MPTLNELVERSRHLLSGNDANKDAVTELDAPLGAADLTLTVTEATTVAGASRGLVEVDMELMRAKSVDTSASTISLFTFGRGYRGTTATGHAAGVEVRFNPSWPAVTVAQEINGVLAEVYPRLYAVRDHETTIPAAGGAIDLPATATGVISVWIEDVSRADQWVREDRWDYQPDSTSIGRGLRVGGYWPAGTGVRVVYAERPGLFDLTGALSQDFVTVTGLPASCADLLHLGVAYRLASFIDVAKLPSAGAAAREMGEAKAPGTGGQAARLLYSEFQTRVDQEALALGKEHPIRLHRVR